MHLGRYYSYCRVADTEWSPIHFHIVHVTIPLNKGSAYWSPNTNSNWSPWGWKANGIISKTVLLTQLVSYRQCFCQFMLRSDLKAVEDAWVNSQMDEMEMWTWRCIHEEGCDSKGPYIKMMAWLYSNHLWFQLSPNRWSTSMMPSPLTKSIGIFLLVDLYISL